MDEEVKQIHVAYEFSYGDYGVYVKQGKFMLTQRGLVPFIPMETPKEMLIQLTKEEATELMDELYRLGVRPTEVGSAGQLAAIKYHLEDMRKLAFNLEAK